jgi:hypothetical protein
MNVVQPEVVEASNGNGGPELHGGVGAREPAAGLEMIQPPQRGDVPAYRWAVAGVFTYLLLVGVLVISMFASRAGGAAVPEFFGLGKHFNLALLVLVSGGVALTVAAMISAAADVRLIRAEEDDVTWVLRHKREGIGLVFAPADRREALLRNGMVSVPLGGGGSVETLMDDRVRRVHAARLLSDGTSVSAEELRIIAEKRTARLGSFPRYASSLLLLLAVLGTFAGVKTALPALIDAVTETGTPSAGATVGGATIAAPLRAVADAFGGNALALIGAIAVGLMAQGLAIGRRNLLERLELASAEYVYGREANTASDPLQAAVIALNRTADEIHSSTGSLLGIESGLEGLGSRFDAAFAALEGRLSDLLEHRESGIHDRTRHALDAVQTRLATMTEVLDANTRLYSGMIEQVGARAAESREAIGELQIASAKLGTALASIVQLGDASARSADAVEGSSKQLAESTALVAQQVDALAAAVRAGQPFLEKMQRDMDVTASKLVETDRASRESWAEAAELLRVRINEQRRDMPTVPASAPRSGEDGQALRHIAEALVRAEAARPRPMTLFAIPTLGIPAGLGISYLIWKAGAFVWSLPLLSSLHR